MQKPMTFTDAARPFIENAGLLPSDLLPLIPHDAKLSDRSEVDPSQRGKIPGVYKPSSGRWVGMTGAWASTGLTTKQISDAKLMPTHNVGLRTASFPAVDLDVSDDRVRKLLEDAVVTTIAPTAIREREGSPRSLMLFRLAGDEPYFKQHLKFTLYGKEHAIDFLGHGQQCVISGMHPSGKPYRWREGHDLLDWRVSGIPAVSAAEMRELYAYIVEVITQAGGVIGVRKGARIGVTGDGKEAVYVADADPIMTRELAVEALCAVPATVGNFPDRDAVVAILSSFRAALGRDAEACRGDVYSWAAAAGWEDEGFLDKIWDSLEYSRVGPDYLIRRARKAGWHGDVKSDFSEMPVEEAERAIAAAQSAHDEQQDAIALAAKQLVYWPVQQIWIVPTSGEMLSHAALNMHRIGMSVAPAGKSGVLAAAAKLRNSGLIQDVVGITYAPGKPSKMKWSWEGCTGLWFNTWRPSDAVLPSAPVSEGDVAPWLDHVKWLFPHEGERNTLLQWMAHLVQKPGVKIRWAPIILGGQGVGKDLMLQPLVHGLGGHNCAEIKPAALSQPWTAYYERQLILVQEMVRQTRFEVYEQLKADITGTGADVLMVEVKHKQAYPVPNTVAFAFTTNHPDAFSISPDDRRFFVIEAPEHKREDAYYTKIIRWYEQEDGKSKVVRYLKDLPLLGFKPDAAPEWTEAKRTMLCASYSAFGVYLAEQLEDGGRFAKRSLLNAVELSDLRDDPNVPMSARLKYHPNEIAKVLAAEGWNRINVPVRLKSSDKRVRLWGRTSEVCKLPAKTLSVRYDTEIGAGRDFTVVSNAG